MKRNLFLTALFACVSITAWSQAGTPVAKKGTAPTPINCTANDPLNPIVGRTYTYTATGSPADGTFQFFATNNKTFMSNGTLNTTGAYTVGSQLISAGTTYNKADNTTNNVTLAWSNTAGVSYLVTHYKNKTGAGSDNCGNDNIKVWKITPKNAFTIEFRNIDKNDSDKIKTDNVNVCFGKVQSASYDDATDKVVYNYGEQKLYYELIVANYDKSFTPTFQVEGLDAAQTATLKWGVDKGNIATDATKRGTNEFTLPKVDAEATTKPEEGVSIYLELTIANGKFEGTNDKVITLKADATTGANNNIKDVKFADCADRDAFDAKITQTLKARPAVTQTGTGDFIAPQP